MLSFTTAIVYGMRNLCKCKDQWDRNLKGCAHLGYQ